MTGGTWQSRLRAQGYRLTPQRELVLGAVLSLGHGTPEEIAAEVRKTASGVNISTVYRTLELLEDLGLVAHTHLGHGPPSYHPAEHDDHIHLVCRDCGAIVEVPPSILHETVERVAADHGFSVDVQHFAVFGTCASCVRAARSE